LPSALPHDWCAAPCLDLINSGWSDHLGSGRQFDRLPVPVFRRAFLKRWGYRVADADDTAGRARLRSLRTFLRGVLEQYMAGQSITQSARRRLEAEINRAPISMRLVSSPEGYVLSAGRSGASWDVVISEIATSAARLMSERATVKVCANPDCSWMFTDETKARTRRWCNVSVCGSLINVRRHRAGRHD
jgi:predicted RNA-binding Zn ribbon-like protein